MKSGRPRIEVPLEPLDIIIDLLSIAILILMLIYTGWAYTELPDIIPSHFNAKGEVDGYSEKYFIWFLPILSAIICVGMFIANRYPHMHNYMINITEENALKNYRFSTRIIRFTNLFVLILFALISYTIVQSANDNEIKLGDWFLPFVIVTSIILPIIIIVYQRKINKS